RKALVDDLDDLRNELVARGGGHMKTIAMPGVKGEWTIGDSRGRYRGIIGTVASAPKGFYNTHPQWRKESDGRRDLRRDYRRWLARKSARARLFGLGRIQSNGGRRPDPVAPARDDGAVQNRARVCDVGRAGRRQGAGCGQRL